MDKDQLLLLGSQTRQALDLLLPFGLGMQVLQEGQLLGAMPADHHSFNTLSHLHTHLHTSAFFFSSEPPSSKANVQLAFTFSYLERARWCPAEERGRVSRSDAYGEGACPESNGRRQSPVFSSKPC